MFEQLKRFVTVVIGAAAGDVIFSADWLKRSFEYE